ncbi:seminase [Drosophila pseudoobscura]|uniref:trypsin n=1 Tax=Drosophila pseudoobscura pseudoobscura TaxID=46245 RepID=A0A6I8UUZ3_DROPS|nr:seminase [Drosophila pseudoobscura]
MRWLWSGDLSLVTFVQLLLLWRVSSQGIQPRIVGGTTTSQSAVGGYVVNLRYDGTFYCGGSLVSRMYVVTAAHCVSGYQASRMTVQGGVSKLSQTGVIRRVARTFVPSTYSSSRLNMDVAVLRLQSSMTGNNIATIPLCSVQWSPGDYMRVSGWGTTQSGSSQPSNQLRTVQIQLIRKTVCQRAYRSQDTLYASTFCARSSGKDSCTGDSGGGVIYRNQLCGIVSWGLGCANANYPGVYTSIHRARSFIVSSMNK